MPGALRPSLACLVVFAGCAHFHDEPISAGQTADAYASRSLSDAGLQSFLRENGVAPADGRWSLDALAFAAFYYQPQLAEARAHLRTIRAAEKTAAERPNPTLTATPAYDNQIPDNPTPWSLIPLSVDVPVETAGKRRYRIEEARATSQAESWNLVGTIWQVRSGVRSALLGLEVARRRQTLLAAQEKAQASVVRLLQGQLSAGEVSGYDLTLARIALATTRLSEQDGRVQLADALTQLSTVLGVPRQVLEGTDFSFALETLPPAEAEAAERQSALVNRADVRAALAEYAASQSALQLEIARQYPDVHLGPGYQYNSGSASDNQWQLSIGFDLPILNQNQGPIAEARAKRKEAASHFLSVQAQAIAEVDGALAGYRVALSELATANTLATELEKRRAAIRQLEETGEADRLATDTAEIESDNVALARLDALAKAQQALGRLEDAVESASAMPPATLLAAEKPPSR